MTPNGIDVLIVTALELECAAVLETCGAFQQRTLDSSVIHLGEVNGAKTAVACYQSMGNVASAAMTATLLKSLRPPLVVLSGIAGGTNPSAAGDFSSNAQFLGDVLVAEQVLDYEAGTLTADGNQNRYRTFPTSHRPLALAKSIKPEDWNRTIRCSRPDGSDGRIVPRCHFGTFASGEKVIRSDEFVLSIREIWRRTVAVEMEGLGMAIACVQTSPPTEFLVVKSICDWANPAKNDAWQAYAAATSAAFTCALVSRLRSKASIHPGSNESGMTIRNPKLELVRRLGENWQDLADVLGIPPYEKSRFERGREGRHIWEWLEVRERLGELQPALRQIERSDLAEVMENPS